MFWRPVAGNHNLKLSWLHLAGATRLRCAGLRTCSDVRPPASFGRKKHRRIVAGSFGFERAFQG